MRIIKENMPKFILALKGFCMGAADVVPGVSGGTMAFILGIYAQLLAAINSFDLVWLKHVVKLDVKPAFSRPHFGFLIPLVIGIFAAIFFFTRIIPLPVLLHTHPEPIYGLFFGLIVGTVIAIFPKQFDIAAGIFLSIGIILGWLIVTLVPVTTPDSSGFIFLSGILSISAMLLPGISGSFILLILRKYDTILNAVGHFNFTILLPFALGALIGLIVFSRFIGWLLTRFYRATLLIITGILIGSLWIIWPFQEREYIMVHNKERLLSSNPIWPETLSNSVILAGVMMLIGIGLVLVIYAIAKRVESQ